MNEVRAKVILDIGSSKLPNFVGDLAKLGTDVYADELKSYERLNEIFYRHETVNHSNGQYLLE